VVSLLDRKPLLLFDELAADQDPGSPVPCEDLLPRLKAQEHRDPATRGDSSVADKIIKME
jgi:ABC-type siderophore export system fused ATPase/permease subunit